MPSRRTVIGSFAAVCSLALAGCGSHPTTTAQPTAVGARVHVSGVLVTIGGVLYQGRDGRGNPMAGAIRWVNTTSGEATTARTNATGHYAIDLDPGTYRVAGGNGTGWPNGSCTQLVDWTTGPRPKHLSNAVALAYGPPQSIYVACEAI